MSLSTRHIPSTKYLTFFFWNKTDKFINSALKHGRFIFEPSYSESIHRLIRNIGRVYFLVANIENQKVEAIIKVTDYKNDIMKFEHKTKCNIGFNEIEEAKEFKNRDVTILQRKLNATYLPVFEAEVSEVYEREIEMFEDIREIIKEKYRQNKKQQETLATYDKIKNTPLMYQLLNYQQMCYAIQKQVNMNQPGQLPSVFQIPGMLNYYQNDTINNTFNIGKGALNESNSEYNFNNIISNSNLTQTAMHNVNVTNFLMGNIQSEPREKYFDLKEVLRYNELERKLRKDSEDETAFYLSTAQEVPAVSQPDKKNCTDNNQERKLSRSRSSHNQTSKKKSNPSLNRSDSEEGFYARKMMTQNKKSKNHPNYNNNPKQTYPQPLMPHQQQHQQQQQQQQHQQNQHQQQQQQQQQYQQHQQHYQQHFQQQHQRPRSFKEPSPYKAQMNQYPSHMQPKYPKYSSNTPNDVKVIDMSNRKKIILNREKTQPEIRINYSNKYYK